MRRRSKACAMHMRMLNSIRDEKVVSGRWSVVSSEICGWLDRDLSSEKFNWVLLTTVHRPLTTSKNMGVQSYRQLIAWQKAMELVKLVYDLTRKFPKEELFGLTLQIRKAVVSIPSNIAEGQGRHSTKDFLRHLSIAYGSLLETETQTLIADMQRYITADETSLALEKSAEVGRLVNGLVGSLERKLTTDH